LVQYRDQEPFVIADIPGLIEGAHTGLGMGTRFLRHIERTAVLLHIIDISLETYEGGWRNYELINRELELFSPGLLAKPQVVAISKRDLTVTRERMKKDIDIFSKKGIKLLTFSAATGEGIQDLLRELLLHIPPRRPPVDAGADGAASQEQPE